MPRAASTERKRPKTTAALAFSLSLSVSLSHTLLEEQTFSGSRRGGRARDARAECFGLPRSSSGNHKRTRQRTKCQPSNPERRRKRKQTKTLMTKTRLLTAFQLHVTWPTGCLFRANNARFSSCSRPHKKKNKTVKRGRGNKGRWFFLERNPQLLSLTSFLLFCLLVSSTVEIQRRFPRPLSRFSALRSLIFSPSLSSPRIFIDCRGSEREKEALKREETSEALLVDSASVRRFVSRRLSFLFLVLRRLLRSQPFQHG